MDGCTMPAVPPMPSTLWGTLGSTPPMGMRQYSSSSIFLQMRKSDVDHAARLSCFILLQCSHRRNLVAGAQHWSWPMLWKTPSRPWGPQEKICAVGSQECSAASGRKRTLS